MSSSVDLAAFVGVSAIVIVTPGQDTALLLRNALAGGRAAGLATALGVALGQACWTVAASVGLAAVLVASEPAFLLLKVAGAAYLGWLGLESLARGLRGSRPALRGAPTVSAMSPWRAARQGLLSNLGNPKMAVFFASLLPQFIDDAGASPLHASMALGLLFCTLTFSWLSLYAFLVGSAKRALQRPAVRRTLDAVMGAALVALAWRLALSER